jgi:hypothetical protein
VLSILRKYFSSIYQYPNDRMSGCRTGDIVDHTCQTGARESHWPSQLFKTNCEFGPNIKINNKRSIWKESLKSITKFLNETSYFCVASHRTWWFKRPRNTQWMRD